MRRLILAALLVPLVLVSMAVAANRPVAATPFLASVTKPVAMARPFTGAKPVRLSTPRLPAVTAALSYTVRTGDTLSSISKKFYGKATDWPVIYWGNKSAIRWADEISPDQVLVIPAVPATIPDPPAALSPAPPPTLAGVATSPAPVAASQGDPVLTSYSGAWPGGAFGQCVVQRESGGDAQAMNSTGHYGLYQFSLSTWEEYGGSAATFGGATVEEQEAVFENAMAQGGEGNWSPYDGC
jgi:Transglycosylase-like domain/LysM domain